MKRKQKKQNNKSVFLEQILLDLVFVIIGGFSLYLTYFSREVITIYVHKLIWWTPVIIAVVASIMVQRKIKEFWRSILIGTVVSIILGAMYAHILFLSGEVIQDIVTAGILILIWGPFIYLYFAIFYGPAFFAINYFAARICKYLLK